MRMCIAAKGRHLGSKKPQLQVCAKYQDQIP